MADPSRAMLPIPIEAAPSRAMLPIPIEAARKIADAYGYDQVVVMARRVGQEDDINGEHITTYGVNPTHCKVAAMMGTTLKRIAQWPSEEDRTTLDQLLADLGECGRIRTGIVYPEQRRNNQHDALHRLLKGK